MEKSTPTKPFSKNVLDQTIMVIDGNLLAATCEKGSYIPDKLIETTDILNELKNAIFKVITSKEKHNHGYRLDLLRNNRRGSGPTCNHRKDHHENQRHSWGPDDTWSKKYYHNNEVTTKTFSSKLNNVSQQKQGKVSTTIKNTESSLRLSSYQPLTRYQDRTKKIQNNTQSDKITDALSMCEYEICEKQQTKKRREVKKMISWLSDESFDYVHSEQVKSLAEVEIFLDVMKSSKIPVQMTLKVNSPLDINLTYQFLPKFKDEFMILKISKTHCMVMRAF